LRRSDPEPLGSSYVPIRSLPDAPDSDLDDSFEDRSLRVETTFDGAGVLSGDLTPECAAVVTAVLDALSERAIIGKAA
jgi:hypothetical protein